MSYSVNVIYLFLVNGFLDGAATNKHTGTTLNTAKLDQESEELKHASLSMDVAKLIQKGRQDKGYTQKDLATVSIIYFYGINVLICNIHFIPF